MSLGSKIIGGAVTATMLVSLLLVLGIVPPGLTALPLFYNTSPSLPRGLYVAKKVHHIKRGDLVRACVPATFAATALDRGYLHPGSCPGGAAHVGKFVAGVAGDVAIVDSVGVHVNGRPLPETAPSRHDGRGRSVQHYAGERVLAHGECFLVSAMDPMSYDSRYFGPAGCSVPLVLLTPVGRRARRRVEAHARVYSE